MLPSPLSKADFHLLYVFTIVADCKGFSAAQVALNVSTSTISRQITDIETRLGMRLCQRGRTGFRLTEKGEIVYRAAQKLFLSHNEFNETIHDTKNQLTGHLSLGVIDNWISNDTAPIVSALSNFTSEAPDVSLELYSLAPDDIEYGVVDGRISIGIGVFHNHKPGLVYEEVGQEYVGLYCGKGHPLFNASTKKQTTELLKQSKLARRTYLNEEKVAPATRDLVSTTKAHQVEGIAMLILSGNFIGYLPQSFAEIWVKEGRMKSISQGIYDLPTPIEFVVKRGEKLGLPIRKFIELLKAGTERQ